MFDIKNIEHKPTIEELQTYIANPLFQELVQYMNKEYEAICTIEYSKDVWLKGWNVKFKKAGKSLCTLYPKPYYFTVLVVVGKKEKERVEAMLPSCSEKVQSVYRETNEGMGQRWLMIDLYEKDTVYRDVLNVIHIRRSLKHGRKYE